MADISVGTSETFSLLIDFHFTKKNITFLKPLLHLLTLPSMSHLRPHLKVFLIFITQRTWLTHIALYMIFKKRSH